MNSEPDIQWDLVKITAWLDQKWATLADWAEKLGDPGTLVLFEELQKAHGDPKIIRMILLRLGDGRLSIVWSLAMVGLIEAVRHRREREMDALEENG